MIPLTLLHVTMRAADYPFDFGANPGSTLRGAFYEGLAAMYDDGSAARSRTDDTNPAAWLLRLEDEDVTGGHDVPRPLAFRPPLEAGAAQTGFGVAVYGRGRDHLPIILSGLAAMGQLGMGRGRRAFSIEGITQIDPLSGESWPLLDAHGVQVGDLADAPDSSAYQRLAEAMQPDQLTVEFLTPIRIIQDGRLLPRPLFRPWFQRLLERARRISEVYTDTPVWIPFRELLAQADAITLVEDETHWREAWSGSRKADRMCPTSGFVGTARYNGDVAQLLPWLILGQALQVGKNTIKGYGWYRMHYHWR
jgi:hypothetical protein